MARFLQQADQRFKHGCLCQMDQGDRHFLPTQIKVIKMTVFRLHVVYGTIGYLLSHRQTLGIDYGKKSQSFDCLGITLDIDLILSVVKVSRYSIMFKEAFLEKVQPATQLLVKIIVICRANVSF